MDRYEAIITEAGEAAKANCDAASRAAFLVGWYKNEIKNLCSEIEELESRMSRQSCQSCHGTGEYQTQTGWHPCHSCNGSGQK